MKTSLKISPISRICPPPSRRPWPAWSCAHLWPLTWRCGYCCCGRQCPRRRLPTRSPWSSSVKETENSSNHNIFSRFYCQIAKFVLNSSIFTRFSKNWMLKWLKFFPSNWKVCYDYAISGEIVEFPKVDIFRQIAILFWFLLGI